MKKSILYLLIIAVLLCLPSGFVSALTYVDGRDRMHDVVENDEYDFVIDDYNVDVKVNEDNTYDITETINVYYFNENSYGFQRVIPLKNTINTFFDGKKEQEIKIYDVTVSEPNDIVYTSYVDDNKFIIDIGDKNKTVKENVTYVISYKYDALKDSTSQYDEFYLNIIPKNIDTLIGDVTFNISFPKAIETKYLKFSANLRDYDADSRLVYKVSDDKTSISGYYGSYLFERRGIILRIELQDGYFGTKDFDYSWWSYLIYAFPIFFTLIAFIIWYMFCRNETDTLKPQKNGPEGFNNLEMGYIYKTSVNYKDVLSLILLLANDGYINLFETEKLDNNELVKGFIFEKLKDYDGNNKYESKIMDTLFKNKNKVTSFELNDSLFTCVAGIKDEINAGKYPIKKRNNLLISILFGVFVFVSYLLITIYPMVLYREFNNIFGATLVTMLGFEIMFVIGFGNLPESKVNFISKVIYRSFGFSVGILFGVITFIDLIYPCIMDQPLLLYGYILGFISIFIMNMFICYMPRYTISGDSLYNIIRAFRLYMVEDNDEDIKKELKLNDNFCYDLLPYAFTLNVNNEWVSKFSNKDVKRPYWFTGKNEFNLLEFNNLIETVFKNMEKDMIGDKLDISNNVDSRKSAL